MEEPRVGSIVHYILDRGDIGGERPAVVLELIECDVVWKCKLFVFLGTDKDRECGVTMTTKLATAFQDEVVHQPGTWHFIED
jgi:hypothetical protein